MKLTTTEKYALAAIASTGKLSDLHKQERGICLVASCIWDMIKAGAVAPDEKGKLNVTALLPEALTYCGSIYKMLAKKPSKPEDVVLEYTYTFTGKRIKALVADITDELIEKSALVMEESSGLMNAKLYRVTDTVLADHMTALKNMDETLTPDQFMLTILLLKSGVAKKLLNKEELSSLKKLAKQDRCDFQPYVKNMIGAVEATISYSIAAAVTAR